MDFFKRRLPTLIVLFLGFGMIAQYYIPLRLSDSVLTNVTIWIRLIAAFTLVIGIISLMRTHYLKMRWQAAGWAYSLVLYLALFSIMIVGFTKGIQSGSPFMWMFENIQVPLTASTFSLTAFFICSAAYRAFIARNLEATVMLITAVIIMIGRIPFGDMISQSLPKYIPGFAAITSWVLDVPGMAAGRAIMLGIGLGSIATSLRIILGIERTYQGKD